MNRLELGELDAFAAIARLRSFRMAAVERGLSPSALSHTMRGLEERLGVRLLNRTTRSVTPTEAGSLLLERLEPAIRDIADALAEIKSLQDVPTGKLRLNVPRPAARLILAPVLGRFAAAFPKVQVEVVTDDRLVDIVEQGFDAGVRFGESLAADMIAVPIGKPQRFVVVASPDYLAARGVPQSPRDLAAHSCIGRRFPSGERYAWEFEHDGRSVGIAVQGALVLDDDEVMVQAAIDGAGLAYVYEGLVKQPVRERRLVMVLADSCPAAEPFYLYYPSRRQMPQPLRAFVDFLKGAGKASIAA